MNSFKPTGRRSRAAVGLGLGIAAAILLATPVYAAGDLTPVIDSMRNWIAGLLAALATLFLTLGGLRYLTAGGNPRAVEQAKEAIRSALIGYGLAALAPLLVEVLRGALGL